MKMAMDDKKEFRFVLEIEWISGHTVGVLLQEGNRISKKKLFNFHCIRTQKSYYLAMVNKQLNSLLNFHITFLNMFYFILKTEQTDDFCICSFYIQRSFFVFHVDLIFHIHCIIKTMTKELILILVVFALFKSYGKYQCNSQLPGAFAYPESNRICFYRPQRSCEGYIFTPVCQSFCSQGGLQAHTRGGG